MGTGFEGRGLAKVELRDIQVTGEDDDKWVCGLCILTLEGPEPGVYGPTISADIAAPISVDMTGQQRERALLERAQSAFVRVASFSTDDMQRLL